MMRDQFTRLHRDGAQNGRVMCVAVHPYNMGQAHRARESSAGSSYDPGPEGAASEMTARRQDSPTARSAP